MKNHKEKYVIEEAFLKRCTDNCNGIIIYGIGEYGKKTVDYFSSTGKKEKLKAILVTDRTDSESEYAGISVIESRMFFKCEENRQHCMRGGGYCVIVAVSLKYQGEIAMILEGYGVEQYYCITRSVLRELEKKVNIETDHRVCEPYRGMDFIIAGFTKCGTTSMHYHYDYWLEKFLMYFSREQIKVILFENLIKDPVKEINDLLDVIGVDERYQANAFPKENAAASQRVGTK